MGIGLGVWALIAYIAIIVIWCGPLKRTVGGGMFVAFIAVCFFGGKDFFKLFWGGCVNATSQSAFYAAMLFVFMAVLMSKTGIIHRLVNILNSIVGRIRGGSAFVSLAASVLFGTFSGSPSANSTTVGSITIPWMKEDGWTPEVAACMMAGNAGVGVSTPPNSSMFILLGLPAVAAAVTAENLYVALWCGGLWALLYRTILVFFFVRKYGITAVDTERIMPLKESLRQGWTSLFIFLGILAPILLTIGPSSDWLAKIPGIGADGIKSLQMIILIPAFIIVIILIEGWKTLPKTLKGWGREVGNSIGSFATIGGPFFFAYCASYALEKIGLAEHMGSLLSGLGIPTLPMIVLVCLIIVVIAGPLNNTATIAAVGGIAFAALTSVGVNPTVACVTILVACSSEGSSPPASAAGFISCGIAGCPINKTFVPLFIYYCIPTMLVAILIALGVLPIIA